MKHFTIFVALFILFTHNVCAYEVQIKKNQIYVDKKPLYGFFVFWNLTDYKESELEKEIKEIKKLGFKGITTEIRWSESEPDKYRYVYPIRYEKLIQMADKYGLLIQLQLSDHYLPVWFNDKDKAKDHYKNNHLGHYLPYSIFSPITENILYWQKTMITHYIKHHNVISVLLSNEPGFCTSVDPTCSDYSDFAIQPWKNWQIKKYGVENISYLPISNSDIYYEDFVSFKKETLQKFLSKKIENAMTVDKKKIYANKHVPYEWKDSYNKVTNLISKDTFKDNFFAIDLYGINMSVIGLLNSMYDKPKWVTETNLDWYRSSAEMKDYLVRQFKEGVFIQTLFMWDKSSSSFKASYRNMDGTTSTKLKGALFAVDDIAKNGLIYINEYNQKLKKLTKVSIAIDYNFIDKFTYITAKKCPSWDKFCDVFTKVYEKFVLTHSTVFPMLYVGDTNKKSDGKLIYQNDIFYLHFDNKLHFNTSIN